MRMPFTHIDRISAWLAATDIAELELRGPAGYLRLRQDTGGVTHIAEPPQADPNSVVVTANSVVVTAQSVGVFLHRHPLHDAPLVRTGARVNAHQPLGLLKIGTLLLPVAAPVPGIVASMQVSHGTAVGFGTELVALHPIHE
jgi:acetyl-CoA carboxylase biotin carboxyl carrier protein